MGRIAAILADLALVIVFVIIGRASHSEALDFDYFRDGLEADLHSLGLPEFRADTIAPRTAGTDATAPSPAI